MSCIKSSLLLQVLQAQEPIKAKNLVAKVSCFFDNVQDFCINDRNESISIAALLLDMRAVLRDLRKTSWLSPLLLHCCSRFPTFDSKRKEKIADATIKMIQKIKIADATKNTKIVNATKDIEKIA
ncbi:hypothetical protein M378DRAFT_219202 [Amanita muscaria Koide BX008]|uniref:Uncharacterized protein n=1 Tax=Amanita muscaria (strain Koide BX008) TaxID=946122 RepID=A0A0C2XPA2_AMAMK|nr:hypothetical protein M378DRAFT_219202 [Amanita muscaria Koide BX008]